MTGAGACQRARPAPGTPRPPAPGFTLALVVALGAVPAARMARAAPPAEGTVGTPSVAADVPPVASPGQDACIDENVRADLLAKRQRREGRDRLFQKTNRHELALWGGYYVSDLFDGWYVVGASYAYHMTEDLAVEASGAYTRLTSTGGPELERTYAVLQGKDRKELMLDADLVWVPAYAKLRVGGALAHFDVYVEAGAGIVDSALSSDIAGNAGFGFKLFLGPAMAVRLDFRDRIYRQELLATELWVNDVTTTLGVSVFLPWSE